MTGQGLEALRFYDELEKRQKQAQKDRITTAFAEGPIPVDDATLDAFRRLFVTDAIEILRSHPGFVLEDKIRSLKTTLGLFERAADDLMLALDRFDAFSRTPEFHQLSHEVEQAEVETAVRKEFFAFSGLAHSVKDHCGRITKYDWSPPEYRDKLAAHFGTEGMHDFICGLRTALHHRNMVEANWNLQWSEEGQQTSHYVFNVAELRPVEKAWNAQAFAYMDRIGDTVDVRLLAEDYRMRVRGFYAWLLAKFEEGVPVAVADCRRCWNEHRRLAMRQAVAVKLSLVRGKPFDPYPHLHKYLRPDQLAEVDALPRHSREQVDLIITMADRLGACDDRIRKSIYSLFGVPE